MEGKTSGFRDEKVKKEVAEGRLEFRVVLNDGSGENYQILTGLKSIFQKQLPKMPREYIARLVYDRKHEGLAILRHPLTPNSVIGGITYRLFPERGFCEIVFCAVSSSEQVKGFGSALMNHLKEKVKERTGGQVQHYLTYADNYAIGYFKKQGFYRQISLDRSVWAGYIKDYDGGTLMQCTMVPNVDYLEVYQILYQQKVALVRKIEEVSPCAKVYGPLEHFPTDPLGIPGVRESGWTPDLSKLTDIPRRNKLYETLRPILNDLQAHPAAWPFLEPVDPHEVPAYYEAIATPMDLATMDTKLEAEQYEDVRQFADDLFLVVKNCRSFNDPDTTYYKNANSLEKFFMEKLRSKDLTI